MKFVEYPNKARNAIRIKDNEYPLFLKIVLKYKGACSVLLIADM